MHGTQVLTKNHSLLLTPLQQNQSFTGSTVEQEMLRLNVTCSLIPYAKQPNISTNYSSGILQFQGIRYSSEWVRVKALRGEANGGGSGYVGRNWDPGMEVEVPFEQRPVNEYSSLKDGPLYSWGELSPGPFFLRLGGLWLGTLTVLGIPIAAASFNPSREPLRFLLAAGTGTLFLVALVVLRIYLGWSYVGDRLLSAVIPYEETGWYDGQMWVKPPEVLARDRLLGSYKVKPVIKLLKQTLVGTGALLVTAVFLFIFATPVENFFQSISARLMNQANVPISTSSAKSNLRKEELLRLPKDVMGDDDLAAAAAEAADGRPVYCRDRYYRALAGGQYCKWEDLVN
ncbi:hypothetical protein IFM89_008002 [Coptis chinensis]|uniref:Uncharacterized protein n=1 Tax=Coptis chinensis TaxID=261450 RepID=A0A835IKM5_9MAGN|nr:hypothetical protein IFM89_008002 [Coptis chinensis]